MFSFSKSDKVLVIAPHPDDESLGTGGLLQRIFANRIPVRIVFATSGENNPWAQRYWERRWRLGANDRARWGKIGLIWGQGYDKKYDKIFPLQFRLSTRPAWVRV